MRTVVIGNSGAGKSTLARRLASTSKCDHVEIDGLLWQQGWKLTPAETYNTEHARLIGEESWIYSSILHGMSSLPAVLTPESRPRA